MYCTRPDMHVDTYFGLISLRLQFSWPGPWVELEIDILDSLEQTPSLFVLRATVVERRLGGHTEWHHETKA